MENKPRILMVEEDVALARTLSSVLKMNGYDVVTAQDMRTATECLCQRPVELVFINSKTFLKGGMEAYERITEIRSEAEVVVMMDSYLNRGPMKEVIEQGLWAPLCKPFTVDELLAVIEDSMRFKTGALFIPVAHEYSASMSHRKAA